MYLGHSLKTVRRGCEHCCDCDCHKTTFNPPMPPQPQMPWIYPRPSVAPLPMQPFMQSAGLGKAYITNWEPADAPDNLIDFTRSAREFAIELEDDASDD